MRLVGLEIEGYRRFKDKHTLQLGSRMVALLGPNEAGKTSVLKALFSLNSDAAVQPDGPKQDVSRGTNKGGKAIDKKLK